MSDLLNKWLLHYDSIHRGWTPRGIAHGVCATRGFAFPRVAGGYTLYRGPGPAGPIDFSQPVGVAGAAARTITTFVWRPMDASSTYVIALKAIGGGGVESDIGVPAVALETDGAGDLSPSAPNAPRDVQVVAIAGGRFALSWRYDARDEAVSPALFEVFSAASAAEIDPESPADTVTYARNVARFVWESDAYDHDTVRAFAVRAVSAEGAADDNAIVVSARARAAGPAVHDAIFAERVEED